VKAVELKKERYPEVMKRMMLTTAATAAENEESDRPNNGDRLQYRSEGGVMEYSSSSNSSGE
jgi:hypothetical protein